MPSFPLARRIAFLIQCVALEFSRPQAIGYKCLLAMTSTAICVHTRLDGASWDALLTRTYFGYNSQRLQAFFHSGHVVGSRRANTPLICYNTLCP